MLVWVMLGFWQAAVGASLLFLTMSLIALGLKFVLNEEDDDVKHK